MILGMKAVRHDDWIGRSVLDRYPLKAWLGGSPHSSVFLTELQGDPAQRAAIKLEWHNATEPEGESTFAETQASLDDPHLLRTLDRGYCEMDGVSLRFVVMEYADEVLSSILPERALTLDETRAMLGPVMDGLAALHARGLVHSRLKSSNIFVAEDRLKISSDSVCRAGSMVRFPEMESVSIAPEVAKEGVSSASDLWSLGATIVEAMSQVSPAWNRAMEPAPVVPSSIPEPFARIARACLQPVPALRCSLNQAQSWLAGKTEAHETPRSPSIAPVANQGESNRLWTSQRVLQGFVALVAFLLAVIAVLHLRPRHAAQSEAAAPAQQQTQIVAAPLTGVYSSPGRAPSSESASDQTGNPAGMDSGAAVGDVLRRTMPQVLPAAKASIRGTVAVSVRITVDEAGNVTTATLVSPGPSRYFSRISLQAAQQWRFKPAPAGSAWILRFLYRQSGIEIVPAKLTL